MLGECFSASGALQTAAALISLREGFIPATINYFQKDPLCDLNVVGDKPLRCPLRNILINSAGAFGLSSSLIVSKFNG
jgi:3-oxoacyl-[acyl-carrier-protein] synthase II